MIINFCLAFNTSNALTLNCLIENKKIYSKELLSAAQQGLISLIKTNIGTLLEVTDSIWIIVKQNINVLVTFVGALFSLLLGGGHAVITFLIDAVIFSISIRISWIIQPGCKKD